MAKLTRVTGKIFGETADATLADPEIGQFGSAKAGTYNGTDDVATIQSLAAWSNGWIDAVTPTQQFPPLPEMTGVHKVLSYQEAYLLQQGIAEWDSATTYYINGFCSKNGKVYISQSDSNLNNDPVSDTVNWQEFLLNTKFDGQWVSNRVSLINSDVSFGGETTKTYDLSSYLPIDNFNYDVIVGVNALTGSTSGNLIAIYFSSDIITDKYSFVGAYGQTRTSSVMAYSGSAIVPVGTSRTLSLYNSATATGTMKDLWVAGYRRIGTNS